MQIKSRHLAALLVIAMVASAHAHGTVETASPKNGSMLTAPPSEIRLKFNQPLEPTFTSVKLFGPSGQEVRQQKGRGSKTARQSSCRCSACAWCL